ncbi:hypothetical protein FB451DRAFT_484268 [Mycena latifolia]|nr:hypothetical protein FB451DRAFT_484268 [Mycena latifolia]
MASVPASDTRTMASVPCTPPSQTSPRSSASPPSLGHRLPSLPYLAAPPSNIRANSLRCLGLYLLEEHAQYLEDERGLVSILEYLAGRRDLQVPLTPVSLSAAAPQVFSSEVCEYLSQYYKCLHSEDANEIFFGQLHPFHRNRARPLPRMPQAPDLPLEGGDRVLLFAGVEGGPQIIVREGRGGGEGGERGRGRGSGRGGGGRGRADNGPPEFFNVPTIDVSVPKHETPRAPNSTDRQQRQLLCRQQAIALAEAIDDATPGSLPPFIYSGHIEDDVQKMTDEATLFHATRLSKLTSFHYNGVMPDLCYRHPNFCSAGPSFSLANTAEQAVSHLLHARPTVRIATAPVDPVVVLAFKVDGRAILQDSLTGFVDMERPSDFLNEDDSEVCPSLHFIRRVCQLTNKQWIRENWESKGLAGLRDSDYHFIVGPFLTPVDDHTRYKVSSNWTRSKQPPVHVAAVSHRAFRQLTDAIHMIYIEREKS